MSRSRRDFHKRGVWHGSPTANFAWWKRWYKARYRHGEAYANATIANPWRNPAPVKPSRRGRR